MCFKTMCIANHSNKQTFLPSFSKDGYVIQHIKVNNTSCGTIHWIDIYSVDSIIHPSSDKGLKIYLWI